MDCGISYSHNWLVIRRIVRFGDTDAAGVMHFHKLLNWCHEAYEESLESFGLDSKLIFPVPSWVNDKSGINSSISLPIVHCNADYRAPLICGDKIIITLTPKILDLESFEIGYDFTCKGKTIAQAKIRHLAIRTSDRKRCFIPETIYDWLLYSM